MLVLSDLFPRRIRSGGIRIDSPVGKGYNGGVISQTVTFGAAQLSGILTSPEGPVKAWVLMAHCFTCNKNYKGIAAIAKVLNEQGYGVLRFDFAGLGDSKGVFADTNFTTNLADVHAAVAFLHARGTPPAILIGHSLGGSAMLAVASQIPSVRGVVTLAAPFEPAGLLRIFKSIEDGMSNEHTVEVIVSGRKLLFKKQFLDDLRGYELAPAIANLGLPLLIFHSPADEITPIANAEKIFQAAQQPKSFVSLDGADHLISQKKDAEFAGSIIATWAARYLPG